MDKRKHIWIVNYYTPPPEFISNERHLKFAHYLQESGYKVTIFSSGFLRENNIDLVGNNKKYKKVMYGEYNYIHVKVRKYKGNGISRGISIFQFAWNILKYRNKFEKPDIILHNIHQPFDYPIVLCAKKLKSKYIVEAWDLWSEAFIRHGFLSKSSPLASFVFYIERKMYENADKIIFSFKGGFDYLKNLKWTKSQGGKIDESNVYYINNGVSIEDFEINKIEFKLNDDDIESPNTFKIIYMGSIRLANDIKQLIDAVSLLNDKKEILLFIYGDGDQRESLIDYCKNNSITNVIFKEKRIPLNYVPYVLSNASLNVLNYKKGFGKYGVSSGKLFQSLASGKPIICNIPINYDNVINDNNLGIADNLDTPEKYANSILHFFDLTTQEYLEMCERVKETAKKFDFKILSNELIKVLDNLD